ncbi:DoxX-like family protein [Pseudoalteromonas piscicida]|uniref:DoxX-like family protein n=1 Tax=Pseudoalteromonas piscicida TaxID=43662 RepID=UPI0030AB873C
MNIIQLARYVIGLTWIYHGLFPKLLQIAPLELAMTGSFGFSEEITYLLIKGAGVGEIIFGLVFIVLYRVKVMQLLNLAGLIGLLVFAAVMTPYVLLEAFNPVTTNTPLMVLGYLLLQQTGSGYAKNA